MVGTKALGSIDKFWTMNNDEPKKQIPKFTKEQYDAILNRHKLKVK